VQETAYSVDDLLRERRQGAARALIRAVGYAVSKGGNAEQVGRFFFDSQQLSGHFKRFVLTHGEGNGVAFATRHLRDRVILADGIAVRKQPEFIMVESDSILADQDAVMGFHGVTRMDMEACVETIYRLAAQAVGLEATYTIGPSQDWLVLRPVGAQKFDLGPIDAVALIGSELAEHRRRGLATGIVFSIGFARSRGDEPEELGRYFYSVWQESGHYAKLRDRFGFGNAFAYAESLAKSRQVLYTATSLVEDLDGFTVSSPGWGPEIPQVMGSFGVLPDDVYRYFAGGGVAACHQLGLQYADQSDGREHRIWIRSR